MGHMTVVITGICFLFLFHRMLNVILYSMSNHKFDKVVRINKVLLVLEGSLLIISFFCVPYISVTPFALLFVLLLVNAIIFIIFLYKNRNI